MKNAGKWTERSWSKTAGIKMAQKMDSFSINIKNEIARKQKEQQR